MNFGGNTPLYCLSEEVLQYQPKAVCLSATIINDIERFSRDFREFSQRTEKLGIKTVLGGRAFTDKQIHARFPAGFFVETFAELADKMRSLHGV